MIGHPILVAQLVMDLTGAALVLMASRGALAVLSGWEAPAAGPVEGGGEPRSSRPMATRAQLRLERRWEAASLEAKAGLLLAGGTALLWLLSLTLVLPGIVPGAMCGTGVLQAMGAEGGRALLTRALALLIGLCWWELQRLDERRAESPLVLSSARLLLLWGAVQGLALVDALRAMSLLDPRKVVDCCSVIYDASLKGHSEAFLSPTALIATTTALGFLLLLLSLRGLRASSAAPLIRTLQALSALLWTPLAGLLLVDVLAPYHYGVIGHCCPWCLFLPEHRGVGFLLFGAIGLILFEGSLRLVLEKMLSKQGLLGHEQALEEDLRLRLAQGARRTLAALIVFALLGAGPALLWRLRFGSWLAGS